MAYLAVLVTGEVLKSVLSPADTLDQDQVDPRVSTAMLLSLSTDGSGKTHELVLPPGNIDYPKYLSGHGNNELAFVSGEHTVCIVRMSRGYSSDNIIQTLTLAVGRDFVTLRHTQLSDSYVLANADWFRRGVGSDDSVVVWDRRTLQCIRKLPLRQWDYESCLALGRFAVVADRPHSCAVYDLSGPADSAPLRSHDLNGNHSKFRVVGGDKLLLLKQDSVLGRYRWASAELYDVQTGQPLRNISLPQQESLSFVHLHIFSNSCLVWFSSLTLEQADCLDLNTGELRTNIGLGLSEQAWNLSLSADQTRLAVNRCPDDSYGFHGVVVYTLNN